MQRTYVGKSHSLSSALNYTHQVSPNTSQSVNDIQLQALPLSISSSIGVKHSDFYNLQWKLVIKHFLHLFRLFFSPHAQLQHNKQQLSGWLATGFRWPTPGHTLPRNKFQRSNFTTEILRTGKIHFHVVLIKSMELLRHPLEYTAESA